MEAEDLTNGRRVWLKCDGLDTVANIRQVNFYTSLLRRYMIDRYYPSVLMMCKLEEQTITIDVSCLI